MSTAIRVLAVLLILGVLAGIGVSVYDAGVSAGLAQQVSASASGAPSVVYPYGPGFIGHWGWGFGGFGFFGIFFWILGIFLVFAVLRAAFGWGRWGRGGGHWAGYGPDRRREMLDAWHREAHGPGQTPPGSAPGSTA